MLRIAFGLVVGMLSAAPAFAQAAAPANNPFVFPGDGGVILNFVKADKTADFDRPRSGYKPAGGGSD